MSSPLTLGFSKAANRLGLKGGSLPAVTRAGELTQVMVVGDLSRSLASEVFEARAFSGALINAGGVGNLSAFAITARSPGGIVVERIIADSSSTPFNLRANVGRSPGPWLGAGPGPSHKRDVGGVATVSDAQIGYKSAPAAAPLLRLDVTEFGDRWYLEPGETLELIHALANMDLFVWIQWRELADIQGAP